MLNSWQGIVKVRFVIDLQICITLTVLGVVPEWWYVQCESLISLILSNPYKFLRYGCIFGMVNDLRRLTSLDTLLMF